MVKRDFSDELFKGFNSEMPIREGIRAIFNNTSRYFEENPIRSSFMEQFENSALISESVRDQAVVYYQGIFRLAERGSMCSDWSNLATALPRMLLPRKSSRISAGQRCTSASASLLKIH